MIVNHIKKFREELGLTQEELGELVGVAQETISQYENETRCPGIIMAKNIAGALNRSLEEVF